MNSVVGKGTRFSIEIPRSEEPVAVIPTAAESLPSALPDLAGAYVMYIDVAPSTASNSVPLVECS
jgi:hypothetical protein